MTATKRRRAAPKPEPEPVKVHIREFADIVDLEEATWAYLNALDEGTLRAKLFPYVRQAMRVIKRDRVRDLEDIVFGGDDGEGPSTERMPVDLLANRMMFVSQTFALEDGTRVEWLKATPAQHRQRAAMQRRLAGKCSTDAERHEQAAHVIEEFNVTCLAEIQP